MKTDSHSFPFISAKLLSSSSVSVSQETYGAVGFSYIARFLHKGIKKQTQSFKAVLSKRCSENMQEVYWGTLIRKYDFSKVAE